jgi:outer membrane receptor protein involved in Fe transport
LPRAPRNKFAANALYTTSLAGGELLLSGTYTWIDDQHTTFFQTPTYHIPAHDEVALRATWIAPRGGYQIMGYVDNLFEEVYPLGIGLAAYSSDLARTWVPADPRTFGVEVQFNF